MLTTNLEKGNIYSEIQRVNFTSTIFPRITCPSDDYPDPRLEMYLTFQNYSNIPKYLIYGLTN
jgi:hypothetical protein